MTEHVFNKGDYVHWIRPGTELPHNRYYLAKIINKSVNGYKVQFLTDEDGNDWDSSDPYSRQTQPTKNLIPQPIPKEKDYSIE